MQTFQVTKVYGHELGFSAAFRQWKAKSHCRFIHGYALSFAFTFEAVQLDQRGWVLDFGALKPLKDRLQEQFDHKTLIAADDPALSRFQAMHALDLIDVAVLPAVGCEAFAQLAMRFAEDILRDVGAFGRVACISATVAEHPGNRATVCKPMVWGAPSNYSGIRG